RLYPKLFHVPEQGATILDMVRAHQGDFVAFSNLVVTGLWLLDVGLAWVARGSRGVVAFVHGLTWLSVLISFLVASIYFFKNNTTYFLGWLMVGAVALSLLIRLFSKGPHRVSTPAA